MALRYKPGDRVRLTREGVIFHGGSWPGWVPTAQGGGTVGAVAFAGDRPHKPGAAPRPYMVDWENGASNSYRELDLELAAVAAELGSTITPETVEIPPTNIVAFRRN